MAKVFEDHWPGALEGRVVTRYGHGADCRRITVVEAGHPVPDQASMSAANAILNSVRRLTGQDLVVCLLSGGGSALLALPAPGLTLADKRGVTRALLRSGADIREINTVRKHLSAIKGGRLAIAAAPARVMTLAISDIPGDDISMIASGPAVADSTTFAEARDIIENRGIEVSETVMRHLVEARDETPKPSDPRLARVEARLIATAGQSLQAAAEVAARAGFRPIILGDDLCGEARDMARDHAVLVCRSARSGDRVAIISGGEASVTLTGPGRGGRNSEYLLALGLSLEGECRVHALACDTDGIDGTEDNAGAMLAPDSLERARRMGLDPEKCLSQHDAYGFFSALGDLVVTGPTRTNVNDFRVVLLMPDGTSGL